MTLKLYYHPLSSFCQKALIALYEREVPFEGVIVDLSDAAQRAALEAVWPIGKFPVRRAGGRGGGCGVREGPGGGGRRGGKWRSRIRASSSNMPPAPARARRWSP